MDLARQAVTKIVQIVGDTFDDDDLGVLVSHEDAELLRRITCLDPLTLERAVEVMGREPERNINTVTRTICEWYAPYVQVRVWNSGDVGVLFREDVYNNPTVGLFACLVLAAKMGEQK